MDMNEALALDGYGIRVKADGTWEKVKTPGSLAEYPPDSVMVDYSGAWGDQQISDQQERDMIDSVKSDSGWDMLTGWSRGGGVAIMHPSEYVGGSLAGHIAETPGLWACVSVEMHAPQCDAGGDGMPCAAWLKRERCDHADYPAESEAAGWALVHREAEGA